MDSNSNKLLTVVIPSYNIENYIERSLISFIAVDQKYYDSFEILVINDGSTDNTTGIVKQLISENSDCNIRLIDKQNGGHGSTINRGIKEAEGIYFKVIDGDDWVDKNAFEQLLDVLKESNEDLIVTNYTNQYILDGIEELVEVLDNSLSNKTFYELPPKRLQMHGITYRTSILKDNNITLSEGIFYVDIQYTIYPMKFIKSWKFVPLNVYQYLLGRKGQSVGLESSKRNVNHHLIVTESMLEELSQVMDDNFLLMVNNTLKGLLERQFMVNYICDNRKELMFKTFNLLEKYSYNFGIRRARKLVKLILLSEKNLLIDILMRPYILKKISKYFY